MAEEHSATEVHMALIFARRLAASAIIRGALFSETMQHVSNVALQQVVMARTLAPIMCGRAKKIEKHLKNLSITCLSRTTVGDTCMCSNLMRESDFPMSRMHLVS